MKNIAEIEKERMALLETDTPGKREKRRAAELKDIANYLRSDPNEEFIRAELKRLSRRIKLIKDDEPRDNGQIDRKLLAKKRAVYNKEMNTKDVRRHIANLRYVLAD